MPFEFNFIEFIDISSIIKISAFSMIPVLVMMLISASLGSIAANHHVQSIIKTKNGDIKLAVDTKPFKIADYLTKLLAILVCAISLPFVISSNITERLLGAFPIASIFGLIYFTRNPGPLREINSSVRATIITIACLLPSISILTGYTNGLNSINNNSPGFLLKNADNCSSNNENKFRYISASGEKLIALSINDKSICITSYKSFTLTPYNPRNSDNKNINYFLEKYKTLVPLKYIFQDSETIRDVNK